ncbi:MAG: MFS transporter [Leptospiraceae bacterium]|nr:MFS transporter [Leptospiraceae bacterium]
MNTYKTSEIVRFLIASFLGFLAGHLTNYSVILYAQDVWNSDLLAGIGFSLCFGVPLFMGWFAGAWCDSYSPTRLAQLAHGSFLIALSLLTTSIHLPDTSGKLLFLGGGFFAGMGCAVLAPARMALLGRIAGNKQAKLAVIFNILVMLGFGAAPPLLAFCKKINSWTLVHQVGIGLFIIAIILLIGLRVEGFGKSSSAIDRIKVGFRYVKSKALLFHIIILSIIIYLSMGPVQVMLPRFATQVLHLDEIGRGFFLGAIAVALLIGGGISLPLTKKIPYGRLIFIMGAFTGIGKIGIGFSTNIYVSVLFLVISGIGAGAGISLIVAILQSESKEEYRGRLVSLYTITSQVIPASSGLLSGIILTKLEVSKALSIAGGLICFFLIIAFFKLHAIKIYNPHNKKEST